MAAAPVAAPVVADAAMKEVGLRHVETSLQWTEMALGICQNLPGGFGPFWIRRLYPEALQGKGGISSARDGAGSFNNRCSLYFTCFNIFNW